MTLNGLKQINGSNDCEMVRMADMMSVLHICFQLTTLLTSDRGVFPEELLR